MCTLTFFPKSNNGFIITSNRDEAPDRKTLPPKIYSENNLQLAYPKDAVAGGTWIGVSEKKRMVCLLNGGFHAHIPEATYRKSRGLVVKELLSLNEIEKGVDGYNFKGIEPFSIVMLDWNQDLKLFYLVWDGSKMHFSEEPLTPQIWSSSLLYSEEIRKKRQFWFSDFIEKNRKPSEESILDFHKNTGEHNSESNLIMDRGFVKTKSVTQIIKDDNEIRFQYEDLISKELTVLKFEV